MENYHEETKNSNEASQQSEKKSILEDNNDSEDWDYGPVDDEDLCEIEQPEPAIKIANKQPIISLSLNFQNDLYKMYSLDEILLQQKEKVAKVV